MTTALADAPPRGAAVWAELSIPVVTPDGWERPEILEGIRQLERLNRQGAAAMAALVAALGDGRDRAGAVRRATGASRRQTKRRLRTADTIGALPEAGVRSPPGKSPKSIWPCSPPIAQITGAEDLVEDAKRCDPDELERRVRRFQLDHEGDDLTSRQRAARGITFYPAEHTNLAVRGCSPPSKASSSTTASPPSPTRCGATPTPNAPPTPPPPVTPATPNASPTPSCPSSTAPPPRRANRPSSRQR